MNVIQILGAVALGVGVLLLFFGLQASEAPVDQVTSAVTGRYTETTMWYLGGGVAAVIGGGLLLLFGRSR